MKNLIMLLLALGVILIPKPMNAGEKKDELSLGYSLKNKRMEFAFDDEKGTAPTVVKMSHDWVKCGGEEAGALEVVETPDFVSGGKGVKIVKKSPPATLERLRVTTRAFPVEPGKTYLFSGWFRSGAKGAAILTCDSGWEKDKKHWWKQVPFKVYSEWRKVRIKIEVPEAAENSTLLKKTMTLRIGFFQHHLNELTIKNFAWEEIK